MDTTVHFALINFERGGLTTRAGSPYVVDRGYWDLDRLREALSPLSDGFDVLGICEAKEWDLWGAAGLRGATAMLGRLFDRPYVGETGWLPLGKSAPALIYDPTRLHLDYWGDDDPTVHLDKRNLARFRMRRQPELTFEVLLDHWPFWSGAARMDRARMVGQLGVAKRRALWMGDFNATPSGPHWPQRDWSAPHPGDAHHKGRLRPDGTFEPDTDALDYLLGRWEPDGSRSHGAGFHAIPEIAWRQGSPAEQVFLPTVNDNIDAGGGLAIDLGLLNDAWRNGLVADTYRVHVPPGTRREDYPSDHRAAEWVLDAAA